jgi:Carbon-nitrogen hydrolase
LIESGTRLAADLGADWVLSGELVVCGYRFPPLLGTDWIYEQPDLWLQRLCDLSAELDVVSFVSHPERDWASGRLFNSLFVIGRDGRLLGRQRKLRPLPVSEAWANRGELSEPIGVGELKVGLLICADAYAAEPALRFARRRGAAARLGCRLVAGPVGSARRVGGTDAREWIAVDRLQPHRPRRRVGPDRQRERHGGSGHEASHAAGGLVDIVHGRVRAHRRPPRFLRAGGHGSGRCDGGRRLRVASTVTRAGRGRLMSQHRGGTVAFDAAVGRPFC